MQGVTTSSSLAHIVCEWKPSTLSELCTTFAESCAKPQTTFAAYHSYKAYFEPLLFAEISAELFSALDKFERLSKPRVSKIRARREDPGNTIAIVSVTKVSRSHTLGFGWVVDIDSIDGRGPVGCVDSDVVAIWPASDPASRLSTPSRKLPKCAVLAVVQRVNTRTGCRLIMTRFPDGNENGIRVDLEEGEENEDEQPTVRNWSVLRLGSLTTMKREFDALQNIKTSVLLPKLLRPNAQLSSSHEGSDSSTDAIRPAEKTDKSTSQFVGEHVYTDVVAGKMRLNQSQARAIAHATTTRSGFAVIQGPPGTGKTRTLIGLLNVIHMAHYQRYYEGLLESLEGHTKQSTQRESKPPLSRSDPRKSDPRTKADSRAGKGEQSLLATMMTAMNKTVIAASDPITAPSLTKRTRRPRLLICAPSNSAVDEVLTRLMQSKFVDGQGREYCPELARIGAGDRVSESSKPFTAEGQAEVFLDRVCAESMTPEARKKAQMAYLSTWQKRVNGLLHQLQRTPKKKAETRPIVIDLHEKLERMDRDLRRLSIAASDGTQSLSRDEKLRRIGRTYIEDAQLVFATLSGAASSILTKGVTGSLERDGALFDTVVIDEAAQATETSCLIPVTLGSKRCILVGDPQQLPATVLSSGAAGLAYGQSLLERVCRAGLSVLLLDTQYRMHPAISSFPRRYFYNGRLVDDESVQGEHRARPFHRDVIKPKFGPYVFLDISEGEERRSRDDRSIFNPAEAELAALIYTKLKKEYAKDSLFSPAAKTHGSVTGFGVVTPYKRQMQELRQSFDRAGIPTGDVEIDTVDSYQGREKDVIVFSCVRTAAVNRGIGFVRDVRRMNVGLTRARASLIILGSAQALAEGSKDWAELVEDASSRGCLMSVTNVSRCLEPELPRVEPAPDPVEQKQESASEKPLVIGTAETITHATGQRNTQGRADPRRRSQRQEAVSTSNGVGLQPRQASLISSALAKANSAKKPEASGQDGMLHTAPEQHGSQGGPSSGGPNSELKATLEQMTSLLSDAGFKNSLAVQKTLLDHVSNGGALDLETVMAAAIATGNSPPEEASNGAKDEPVPDAKVEDQSMEPCPADPSFEKRKGEPVLDEVKEQESKGASMSKDTGNQQKRRGDPRSAREISKKHKSEKSSKKKKSGKKGSAPVEQEPSGWDLLFSKKGGAGGSDAPDNSSKPKPVDASQTPEAGSNQEKLETRARGNGTEEKAKPADPREKGKSRDFNEPPPVPNPKRPWLDRPRDERKRSRGGDHSGRGRGVDRGRNQAKRERSGYGNGSFDDRSGNGGFREGEGWGPQVGYDPNMAGYAMMPNMMDPSMAAGGQAVNQMAMQQAMQQQLLQQQVYQQQAMQQPFYQQTMPFALQQQQAMQQEAFRQQAMMMQMSAAGMQPGIGQGQYPVEYEAFNSPNETGASWGNQEDHSHNRRGGSSGRGRGRYHKGGRGGRGRRR